MSSFTENDSLNCFRGMKCVGLCTYNEINGWTTTNVIRLTAACGVLLCALLADREKKNCTKSP